MKQEAVTAETFTQTLNRVVRDAELARDLAKAGAGNETMKDGFEEILASEPIVRRKGL